MRDLEGRGIWDLWELSLLSAQLFYQPETSLIKPIKLKNNKKPNKPENVWKTIKEDALVDQDNLFVLFKRKRKKKRKFFFNFQAIIQ